MKRCPQCGREYDATMMFCLDDGAELLYGPAAVDEPETAILREAVSPNDAVTRMQIPTKESDLQRKRRGLIAIAGITALLLIGGFFAYRHSTSGVQQINSIAVLPFHNVGESPDTEYLSDGLAESLIYRLSQLPDFKVSPVTSVVRYKGREADPGKVASELGVQSVMYGRITQRGDNLNISVELIDAANNKVIWGEQYERKMSDLLTTQREIASTIVEKLEVKLSGDGAKGLTKKYTNNSEAYQAYLKGRFYWSKRGGPNLRTAVRYFEEAINLDPNFGLAWSGLGDAYVLLPEYTDTPVAHAVPKARQAVQKAIDLDQQLAEAHASLGHINYTSEWDFAGADAEFRKAIEINAKYATAHQWYSEMLSIVGRHDEAIDHARTGAELEPLSALQKLTYANALFAARRHDEAAKLADAGLELDPQFARINLFKAQNAIERGDFDGAFRACEKAMTGGETPYNYCPALVYAKKGETDLAMKVIGGEPVGGTIGDMTRAMVYAMLGENDKSFDLLERLYRERSIFVVYIKTFPSFDTVRTDPRYHDLVRRIGLPQ